MNSSGSNQSPQARRQVTVDNEHFLPSYQDPTTFPFPDNAVSPFEYSIFPKDIFIYREEYISLILGPPYKANSPRPTPLFYVSIHMDNRWTNNSAVPQIRVYFGPDETYPIIGTSSFRYSTTSDIIIWPNRIYSTNGNSTQEVSSDSGTSFQLTKTSSMMKDMNVFHYRVRTSDGTLTSEKFEWKHSGDPEVQAFATENIPGENISQEKRGLKLVRVSTGLVSTHHLFFLILPGAMELYKRDEF